MGFPFFEKSFDDDILRSTDNEVLGSEMFNGYLVSYLEV